MTDLMSDCRCLAVIPAYQEGSRIARVVHRALLHATEVLVVDDGSDDDTARAAEAAGATVLRHEHNLGKGRALSTGLAYAAEFDYEIAVTLDGDGQHDPREIPKLLRTLNSGADIAVGCRMRKPDGMPLARLLTNKVMSTILAILTKHSLRDTQSGFKALRIPAVRKLRLGTSRFDWESELIIWAARRGLRMRETDIRSIYSNHHRSKICVVSDTIRFVKLVLSNIIY